MSELRDAMASLPLSDVARDRNRCSAQLRREPIHFFTGKLSSDAIHHGNQVHRLLPDYEIAIRLAHSHLSFSIRHQLATDYWLLAASSKMLSPRRESAPSGKQKGGKVAPASPELPSSSPIRKVSRRAK